MTITEKRILEDLAAGAKTFSTLQDGERVMTRLMKMIEEDKIVVLKTTKDYVWKSIGGAVARKPVVQLTVGLK